MHGDPIAGTPSDAVAAFRQMAIPESVLLVADRVFSLPEIERLYGPAVRLTPRVRHGEPRRRREACVCVVRGAVADELCGLRASIKDLGLRIAAERHVGDEARAFLVVGSESSSLMDRWASAQSHRPTWLIETGACDLHVSGLLRQIFPNEIGGDIGSFADLLLWPGELSADAALSQLERESSLTLAGLLFPLRRLLRPAAEEFRSDRQLAAVFGTTARVKSAPGGRMYMYAPEGYRALQRLVAELASDIQAGNFLRCRESGLVLAYSPPRSCSDAELNAKVRAAVALGVDGLVAVDPRLSVTSAVRLEMIGRSHGLAITGGSGCLVRQRATRPLGVRSSVLGRFVNRFPGLEL